MVDSDSAAGSASDNSSSPSLCVIQSSKIDELLLDLKIIGSIKVDEKINTSHDIIDINPKTMLECFSRWVRGENRYKNISFVKIRIYQTFECIESGISEQERLNKMNPSTPKETRELTVMKLRNSQFIDRLRIGLDEALGGIRHIGHTYQNDSRTFAFVALLQDKILDYLKQIDVSLRCISKPTDVSSATTLNSTQMVSGQSTLCQAILLPSTFRDSIPTVLPPKVGCYEDKDRDTRSKKR
jgi:hypothetical protein